MATWIEFTISESGKDQPFRIVERIADISEITESIGQDGSKPGNAVIFFEDGEPMHVDNSYEAIIAALDTSHLDKTPVLRVKEYEREAGA